MRGLPVLHRKELLESWRTLRMPIVGGLFLLVGLTSPLLAKFLPEIIEAAAGDQLPTIPIPTPVMADAADQLWKNLAQFGAFAAIILAMGSVSGELDRGTAAFVLSKTATRGAFLGREGRRHRAGARGVSTFLAVRGRLDLHRDPVRTARHRRLDGVRRHSPGWACVPGPRSRSSAARVTGSTAAAAGIGFMALLVLSVLSAIPTVSRTRPGRAGRAGARPGRRACRSRPATC